MKYFQLILFCSICIAKSYGQAVTNSYVRVVIEITKEKKSSKGNNKIVIKSFLGIDSLWVDSLEKKLNQSIHIDKHTKKGKYIVTVKFIRTKDGSLSDVLCENDPGFGLCQEVMNVIKRRQPWTPAPSIVRPYRRSAITFQE
jgi:translation initiation factor 1 (eIF-1/SUI1)